MRYTFDELIQEQQEEYELEVLYQLSNYLVKEVIMEQYVLEEDTAPLETAGDQNQQQPSSSTQTPTPTSEPPKPTGDEQQPQTGDAQPQQNPSLLDKIVGVIKRIFGAIFGFFGKIIGWIKGLFTRGKNVETQDPTPEDEQQEATEETPQQFPTENTNDPEANAEITENDIAQIFTQNENVNADGSQASPGEQPNPNQPPTPNDQNQQPAQNQNGEFNRSTPLDVQSLRESTDQLDADVAKKKSTVGGLLDSLKQTFGIDSDNNGDAQAGNDANQPNNPNQSGGNAQQTSQEMQSKLSQVEQQFSQLEQQLNSGNLSEEDQQSLSQQLDELRSDLSSVKEMTNGKVPQKLPALAALSPTATVNWYMKHDPEGLDLYIQSLDKRTEILKKQQEFSALKKSTTQKNPNLLQPLRELQDELFGQGRIDRANANAQVAEAKQKEAEAKLGQKTAEANMRTVNAQAKQTEAEAKLAQTQANAKRNNIKGSFTPAGGNCVTRFFNKILGKGTYSNTGSSGSAPKGDTHTYNINYTGLPGGAPPPGAPPAPGSPTPTPAPSGLDPSDPTVAALMSQLTDIQTKVTDAETKLSDIETKVDGVESKVDSVETKVDDVGKDLTRVNAKQNQILSNVKTKFQQLSSSMAGVRKDIKDARKSISGQIRDAERSTNDNIENAVHTLNANDGALSSQIDKAKQETLTALNAAKAELEQKFSDDLKDATNEINDNTINTADALATNIKNTATGINANINNVNTNVNNLQQSLDDHMGYRAGAEADIKNQLNGLQQSQTQQGERMETIANDQHERMGAMKQQLNGLQQGQQELNNKMDQANVTQQQMLTNITSAIQSGQRNTEDLVNQITQLNEQVKQLTETVQQNASSKQELIDKLTSQMNQVSEDQKKAYEDQINQLKEEVKQIVDNSNFASSIATLTRFSEIIELAKQDVMTNSDENMKNVLQQIVNSTESLSQDINGETITQANRVIDEIKNMNQKNEQPIITQTTNPDFDPNNTKKLIYKSQLPVKIKNKFKNIKFKLVQKPDDPTTYDIVIYKVLVPYDGCLNNVISAYDMFTQYAMQVCHTDVNGITQMGSNYATKFSNIPTNVTESAQMNGTRSLNDLQRDIIKLLTFQQDQPPKWTKISEFNDMANRLSQLDQQSKQLQNAFSQILKGLEMEVAEAKKNRNNVNKTQQKLITFQKRANDMLAMLVGTPGENEQPWRSIRWYINNTVMVVNKQKAELDRMATMTSEYIRKNSAGNITMTNGGMNQPPQTPPKTMTNVG